MTDAPLLLKSDKPIRVASRKPRKFTASENFRKVHSRCRKEWIARVAQGGREHIKHENLDKISYAEATQYHGIKPMRGTVGLRNYEEL